jgi:hypothetical protein
MSFDEMGKGYDAIFSSSIDRHLLLKIALSVRDELKNMKKAVLQGILLVKMNLG